MSFIFILFIASAPSFVKVRKLLLLILLVRILRETSSRKHIRRVRGMALHIPTPAKLPREFVWTKQKKMQ
jgi:hypothetical protein